MPRTVYFRIDNRLVHGQVIEAWLPYTGARDLVVANDALAEDMLRQQIISLAVPQRVAVHFIPLNALEATLAACKDTAFVLFMDCGDAFAAFSTGMPMSSLNIGNLHYSEGKRQLLPHVAVSPQEEGQLRSMRDAGVSLDFRCVPTENTRGLDVQLA